MAVQLYALVGFNGAYTEHTNFQDFWTAMITLMSFSTGENWNGFMYDVALDDCIPLNGCGSWTIFPFLYSFTLIVTFVMLNLFIAVILEGFSDSSEDDIVLSPEQLSCFQEAWAELDPDATCFAPVHQMSKFLNNMFDAFGLSQGMTRAQVEHEIIQMQLPIYEEKYGQGSDVV